MSQIADLLAFLFFLAIVCAIRLARDEAGRRRGVTILLLYLVLVYAGLVATRRDAWPFVTHGVFLEPSDAQRPFTNVRFVGVDASGEEHRIDPRSWSPFDERTLDIWWLVNFVRLDPQQQQQALRFMFDRAERARRLLSAGARVGRSHLLGFAAAPKWYSIELPPPAAHTPFAALRVYLVTRTPAKKFAGVSESSQLVGGWPR